MDSRHSEFLKLNPKLEALLERLGGESRIHYSLHHFEQALKAAQSPHLAVQTIAIAGTNGKGSVSLFVSSALSQAGYQTGTFLSPHLQSPTERILHNLVPIDANELESLALEFEPIADRFSLTYFEFMALLCFVWAKRVGIEYLVLEVGMGGRLDATNVTTPVATVITNIDWDHQAYLGDTLLAILGEKMGILRPGVPVFTQLKDPELLERLQAHCARTGSALHLCPVVKDLETSWEGQRVEVEGLCYRLRNPGVGMGQNAATAMQVVRHLFPEMPRETLRQAIERVRNPARLETVRLSPRVVLSGDHNPAGIDSLLATLDRMGERPHVLCGFSPDKPHGQMVDRLRTHAKELTLTCVPRFLGKMPAGYESLAPYYPDPIAAVNACLSTCAPTDTLLITGSLYLVGELRKLWHPSVSFV